MTSLPIISTPSSCDGCGACCREQESPPAYAFILAGLIERDESDPDWIRLQQMPDELIEELHQYIEDRRAKLPRPRGRMCIWFDEQTRKCRHYDWRPDICREELQLGDDSCLGWREIYADTLPT